MWYQETRALSEPALSPRFPGDNEVTPGLSLPEPKVSHFYKGKLGPDNFWFLIFI